MEGQGKELLLGDALAKEVDKKGKMSFFLGEFGVNSLLKTLHLGKVTSQDQHESKATKPLGGHFEPKDLVNGSERFNASIPQASNIYTSEGINLVFHDRSLDTDFSNRLTKLLEYHKIRPSKANESQIIALETLISGCINQDGCGTMPWTLILSKETENVRRSTSNQSLEKVKLTEHTIILPIPYANPYTFTEEIAREIAEKFLLHYKEGIQVVYLLGQRFHVTVINAEKAMNLKGTELPGQVFWELHQLKLTELIEGYFKSKEDLANGSDINEKQEVPKRKKY